MPSGCWSSPRMRTSWLLLRVPQQRGGWRDHREQSHGDVQHADPTNEPSVVSASASFLFTAATGGGPVFVHGEEVERVRVTANPGGPSTVAYVTRSGREVPVSTAR